MEFHCAHASQTGKVDRAAASVLMAFGMGLTYAPSVAAMDAVAAPIAATTAVQLFPKSCFDRFKRASDVGSFSIGTSSRVIEFPWICIELADATPPESSFHLSLIHI